MPSKRGSATTSLKPAKPLRSAKKSTTAPSREKLLRAAFQLFAERGFHATTTKMISEKAGVNEALISRHFGTKDGLFTTVVHEHMHSQPSDLPYPAQASFEKEAVGFANSLFEECSSKGEFLRMLIAHCLHEKKLARQMPEELGRPTSPAFLKRIRVLQRSGKLPKRVAADEVENLLRNLCFSASLLSLLDVMEPKAAKAELLEGARRLARGYLS